MPKKTCSPKPRFSRRPLISAKDAGSVADLFTVLANDTRLRLLHALVKGGELCVSEIAKYLEMKPQAVSNQLQRLIDKRVLESRREGNSIYYRIVNPCIPILLDRGLCLMEEMKDS